MNSDYELYLSFSTHKRYSNQIEFQEKIMTYLKMDREQLQINFNVNEENDNEEECILILLVLMRRKGVVYFDPYKKLKCDYCHKEDNDIIILKDCYHGICRDCLTNKVKSITESLNYNEYYDNQNDCLCNICGSPITISNLHNMKILKEEDNKENNYCDKCEMNENEHFFVMKKCNYRICEKKLNEYFKSEFIYSKQNNTLENMKCLNNYCTENISYYLIQFVDVDELLQKFPTYFENYLNN